MCDDLGQPITWTRRVPCVLNLVSISAVLDSCLSRREQHPTLGGMSNEWTAWINQTPPYRQHWLIYVRYFLLLVLAADS